MPKKNGAIVSSSPHPGIASFCCRQAAGFGPGGAWSYKLWSFRVLHFRPQGADFFKVLERCDWKMKVKRKWMISDWISEFHWHFGRIPGKIMRYKFYNSQILNWLKGIIWSIPKSWRNNQHTETLGTIVGLRLDVKILGTIIAGRVRLASMLDCWQWKNPKWMVKTFPTTCIYLKFTLYVYIYIFF